MAGAGFPLLIAHTPRAGRWNHVALAPPGGLPAGTDAAAYLSVPPGSGANYVAASSDVEQPTTGRTGREVLVLIGVTVPEGERRDALEAWLRLRLGDLGTAVASFDWEAHAGGSAYLPELAVWRDRVVAEFGLVTHPTTETPLTGTELRGASRRSVFLTVALAVAGTLLLSAGLVRQCGR